jgi:hypothetical protein
MRFGNIFIHSKSHILHSYVCSNETSFPRTFWLYLHQARRISGNALCMLGLSIFLLFPWFSEWTLEPFWLYDISAFSIYFATQCTFAWIFLFMTLWYWINISCCVVTSLEQSITQMLFFVNLWLTSSETYKMQIMKNTDWAVAYHMYVGLIKGKKKTVTKYAFDSKDIIIRFSYLIQKVPRT